MPKDWNSVLLPKSSLSSLCRCRWRSLLIISICINNVRIWRFVGGDKVGEWELKIAQQWLEKKIPLSFVLPCSLLGTLSFMPHGFIECLCVSNTVPSTYATKLNSIQSLNTNTYKHTHTKSSPWKAKMKIFSRFVSRQVPEAVFSFGSYTVHICFEQTT